MGARWDWIERELEQLHSRSMHRQTTPLERLADGKLMRQGRVMIDMCSNDYLGLAREPGGLEPGARSGAGASRLITGTDERTAAFESEFAAFKGQEACVLFGSGYMANVGLLSALAGRDDVVFSDRLNHASIVDGIVLSRAEHRRYRHRDLDQLETMLKQAAPGRRKFIVTDAVFSMDGTVAPLRELAMLKRRYGAALIVDEAHSGGVYGDAGQGLAHAYGLTAEVDVHMGTFSKAYGCYGAYVAGDRVLVDYMINRARSLIYSTALPPVVVQAIRGNWQRSLSEGWRREALRRHAARFRAELAAAGFDIGGSETQIVPVVVGDNAKALAFERRLRERGIAAAAIRPPTVPEGGARIRFSLSAAHREDDLREAAGAIIETGKELGLV